MENDVEVFIDGGDCYYEFEINARGTIYTHMPKRFTRVHFSQRYVEDIA
jgi:hypothetical protein